MVISPLDHLQELLFLVLPQLLVLLDALYIQLVLGLRPWWLEWTGENRNLGVPDSVGHLRVRHVLVDNNTLEQRCVVQRSTDFTVDLDQFEIDISAGQIGNREDGVNGNGSKLVVGDGDTVVSDFQNSWR